MGNKAINTQLHIYQYNLRNTLLCQSYSLYLDFTLGYSPLILAGRDWAGLLDPGSGPVLFQNTRAEYCSPARAPVVAGGPGESRHILMKLVHNHLPPVSPRTPTGTIRKLFIEK